MEVTNAFTVDAPLEAVWSYLLDVRAVAPCVPGAELTDVIGDREYRGTVKVKLGAVSVSYKGTLNLTEVDPASHRVVLTAAGSDTRGGGSASGTITSTLVEESPSRTTVQIRSEISVTGRVAQFGRNLIQDVSNRLIKEFAACLERNLTARQNDAAAGIAGEPLPAGNQASENAGAPRPDSEPASSGGGGAEIKVLPVLADVARTRMSRGLRSLAKLIEPKDGEAS